MDGIGFHNSDHISEPDLPNMVEMVGFEPTVPEGRVLQTLRLPATGYISEIGGEYWDRTSDMQVNSLPLYL